MTANTDETRYTAGAKDAGLTDEWQSYVNRAHSALLLYSGIPNDVIDQMKVALLSAQAEVKQAEDAKDAERLDFVLNNSAFIIATISSNADCDVTTYQLETQDEDENYITLSGDEKYFKSKREAIDAAIQSQGAKQT